LAAASTARAAVGGVDVVVHFAAAVCGEQDCSRRLLIATVLRVGVFGVF